MNGHTVGTAFDDYEMKSLDDKQYQVTERENDPEIQAKEDYMRKLMSFRKDELILPEESEDEEIYDIDNPDKKQKEKSITGVEDAYELVDKIEEKMNQIANVIRGMDKRMSYNLRLMGSVLMQTDDKESLPNHEDIEDIKNLLKNKSIGERKNKVIPKIKRMTEFATNKLAMNGSEDQENVKNLKKKLQSITPEDVKNKVIKKGIGTYIIEQYMHDNDYPATSKRLSKEQQQE